MTTAVFTGGNASRQRLTVASPYGHARTNTQQQPQPRMLPHSLPQSQPRLRITARGRAVLLALVTTPLVAIILALSLASGGATATGSTGAPLQSVTVLAGQSLWTLAEQVAPQADPREFIADVIALNGLSSAELRPGQSLQIPSAYSHGTSAGASTH